MTVQPTADRARWYSWYHLSLFWKVWFWLLPPEKRLSAAKCANSILVKDISLLASDTAGVNRTTSPATSLVSPPEVVNVTSVLLRCLVLDVLDWSDNILTSDAFPANGVSWTNFSRSGKSWSSASDWKTSFRNPEGPAMQRVFIRPTNTIPAKNRTINKKTSPVLVLALCHETRVKPSWNSKSFFGKEKQGFNVNKMWQSEHWIISTTNSSRCFPIWLCWFVVWNAFLLSNFCFHKQTNLKSLREGNKSEIKRK